MDGNFSSGRCRYIEENDLPSLDCQLKSIEVIDNKVQGEFFNVIGSTTDTIKKEMEYNLQEMIITWK